MGDKVRGYLVVNVAEASGKNKDDEVVWDPSFTEGFCKVEIRGGERNVKVQSSVKKVLAHTISWQEELRLEVLEEANELRLMLCREKRTGTRVGTSVISACGIYVSDIVDAVPIDKYFELFKPGMGGEGGFIRVAMNFVTDLNELQNEEGSGHRAPKPFIPQLSFKGYSNDSTGDAFAQAIDNAGKAQKKRRPGRPPFIKIAVVAAIVAAGAIRLSKK